MRIPLDSAAYAATFLETGFQNGRLAASPDVYRRLLARPLLDAVAAAVRTVDVDTDLRVAAQCVLFDIYMELQRVGRACIDLQLTQKEGGEPCYESANNPLLSFLDRGGNEAVVERWAYNLGRHAPTADDDNHVRNWLRLRRRDWRLITMPRAGRNDLLSRGPLIDRYLEGCGERGIDLLPYIMPWPEPQPPDEAVRHLAQTIVEAANAVVAERIDDPVLLRRGRAWSEACVRSRLARSLADHRYLQSWRLDRYLSDVLLTGAPKPLGRLLSHHYRSHGRRVYRFAHGGERAFFDDYYWGACEISFCDRYYGHGTGEARNLERRAVNGQVLLLDGDAPTFVGLGSPRHEAIFRTCCDRRPRRPGNRKKRIMFIPSSLLGERLSDTVGVKPPDVHLIDLEARICADLRNAGYHVAFKLHPRGDDQSRGLRSRFGNETLTGFFDATTDAYDCLLFDYAGSAFFDALASDAGIVLIDTGVRPIDPSARDDLAGRCRIVPATAGDDNRLDVDSRELLSAINEASESDGCSEAFFMTYFRGDA